MLKNDLAYGDDENTIKKLTILVNKNEELQKILHQSKIANEQYHKQTDQILDQCNNFMRDVFITIDHGELRDYALPLEKEEMQKVLAAVKEYRDQYIKFKRYNDKIVEEATTMGYDSTDVGGAIQYISRCFTEGVQNGDVDDLQRTITDMTSASDKRKQNSKEAVDKYRKKYQKSQREILDLKETIAQLINIHTHNTDEINYSVLRKNLNEDQLEILEIPQEEEEEAEN